MSAIPFTSFYLECDADGCDESFLTWDATEDDVGDVRRAASRHGWTVGGARDYCSDHEREESATPPAPPVEAPTVPVCESNCGAIQRIGRNGRTYLCSPACRDLGRPVRPAKGTP